LNDDFVRTFTISSLPTSSERQDEFEITIKKVGRVTQFLFQQNVLAGYEVPILGVGGEFEIVQKDETITPFIAGGVGITPLLGQLGTLDLSSSRFKLYWTLRTADISLVLDTLGQFPGLAGSTAVFLTGDLATGDVEANVSKMRSLGTDVNLRRLNNEDLDEVDANTWYLCAGKILRKELLGWLKEKIVVFEDFDF
jgi:predicted ferric reductase